MSFVKLLISEKCSEKPIGIFRSKQSHKQHASVDMQSGLINKVAVTPLNQTDSSGFKHVCPSQGATYADKGYCVSLAQKSPR